MNLRTFFGAASPATLASLIADIELLDKGASVAELSLAEKALTELVNNIGEDDARRMIDASAKNAEVA